MSSAAPFSIPVVLRESRGIARAAAPVRIGIPLRRGAVQSPDVLEAADAQGATLPFQGRVLGRWPDGSIKWLLAEALCPVPAGGTAVLHVRPRTQPAAARSAGEPALQLREQADVIEADTGAARFSIARHGSQLLRAECRQLQLLEHGLSCTLTDSTGGTHTAMPEDCLIEECGPVSATLRIAGSFTGAGRRSPLRFNARLRFIAGSANLQLDFTIWNPQAALHAGGLWDLGDPGSYRFRDLSLSCRVAQASGSLHWHAGQPGQAHESSGTWTLYQDSSGGDCWDSPNHVDHQGELTVNFAGYRVWQQSGDDQQREIATGLRATPCCWLPGQHGGVGVAVRDFWQCFPKALRREEGRLEIGLFPRESTAGFELQGGEQKRHTMQLGFGPAADFQGLAESLHPVEAAVDPAWIESTGAITWFASPAAGDDARYLDYVNQIISGERSFAVRREIIDEYGWRNFGDLYADHEAVNHQGTAPFISHYNNQYDFIYGAFLHWQRTGDARWRSLMEEAARHSIDIDLYRTRHDRPEFNGGLFWHTDHHKPAATCTHRTYSRANAGSGAYGGGPSDEQDYSSGMLHYYFATGDQEGADAVRMLADWVIAMDDGARAPLAWFDAGPTGLASCTVDPDFHKPGRGAGNSINTLLDAFCLASERRYLDKAGELIRRCIHPRDDVPALRLDEPEFRWSYLVFLQAVGKYLHVKRGCGEFDSDFHHACASLLHYAAWMAEHEVPYKDVLHKVLLPTETWPAHDIRKCHVLHLAAEYSSGAARERFAKRALFFYQRCLDDLLGFPSAWLTRPLVILTVYGTLHDHFRRHGYSAPCWNESHGYDFGTPAVFVSRRRRIAGRPLGRLLLIAAAIPRLLRERWMRLRQRLLPARARYS